MPALDRKTVQIVFLEMQPEIIASSSTHSPNALRRAAAATVKMAQGLDIPMLASIVPLGAKAPALTGELASINPHVRTSISLFGHQPAHDQIVNQGRRTIVVAGVSMEIAVLHTVLDARHEGFDVHVLVDGCGGLSARSEAAALRQMEAAGAVISSVSSFFTGLIGDMAAPEGGIVMGALAELWSWDKD